MSGQMTLIITVPLITAFIGYFTNWAAIKMMFAPAEPKGIGPLKWQGIVYAMADKFAHEISATTSQVLTPDDIVERLAPDALVARLVEAHPEEMDGVVREAVEMLAPGMWEQAAPEARDQLRTMILGQATESIDEVIERLGPRMTELLDLDALLVDELTGENADRLARVAQELGSKELRFVEFYGGVFGFAVGLVQVALYGVFGIWWTMPIVGGIVGLGTNYLAIQMIFRPLEPKKYLGLITYQGMFPKRQHEIAADYGAITAREIFTPEKLVRTVAESPMVATMAAELRELVVKRLAELRPMLAMMTGGVEPTDAQLAEIVDTLGAQAASLIEVLRPTLEAHLGEHLELEALIEERLGNLDKAQFERMLRGIFEEDEWILIVVGGALGAAIGTLQGLVVRGLDL